MIFAREAVQTNVLFYTIALSFFVRFFYISCFEPGVLLVQPLPFYSSLDAVKSEEV